MTFAILLVIVLVCLSMSFLLLKILTPWKIQSFEAHVKVGDYVGINLDVDKLYFGTVMKGGVGKRGIIVNSPRNAFVLFSKEGSAADWIVSPKSVFLTAGQNKSVEFEIKVPSDAKKGNYTANISLMFYNPLAETLLD